MGIGIWYLGTAFAKSPYCINHSVKHSVEHSIEHSIDHSIEHSIEHSTEHSIEHPMEQSIDHFTEHFIEHSMDFGDRDGLLLHACAHVARRARRHVLAVPRQRGEALAEAVLTC